MQKKLLLLFILVLLFGVFIAVRFLLAGKQDVYGRLQIISSPNASVFINNVASGQTPFDSSRQKAGEYIIKLIPDNVATQTASWQGKVQVYKNALTYVNRELGSSDLTSAGEIFTVIPMEKANGAYGEVYIETEPQGAIVYLDNDEKGVAPVVLADVTKGDHELSVFMPGFLRRTQKINVDAGYRVNANFKLAIDENQQLIPTPRPDGDKEATQSAEPEKKTVTIKDTPTGFLRVREEPSVNASESAQVKPGETFDVLEENSNWYKISYSPGKSGWISAEYTTVSSSR